LISAAELEQLKKLKKEIAITLLALDPEEVFTVWH
jgi:hypothetical protein